MGPIAWNNSCSKKIEPPTDRELTTAMFLLRAKELGLSIQELSSITVGMVFDMLIERNNDNFTFDVQATVSDVNNF